MCDQTVVSYAPDDIVWVKLSHVWWPGQVQDEEKLSEDVTSGLRKKPLAVVKFFDEDYYEFVKNLDQIYHYNCRRKDEFIKKGLELYRRAVSTVNVPSNMKFFRRDVQTAEKLTGGDPNYTQDQKFLPEKKFDYSQVFGGKKGKGIPKKSRSPPGCSRSYYTPTAPSPEPRPITNPKMIQKALTGKSDYEYRIRLQNVTPKDDSGSKNYSCDTCGFTTARINLFILHRKTHSESNSTSAQSSGRGNSSGSSRPIKTPSTPLTRPEKKYVKSKKRKTLTSSEKSQKSPSTSEPTPKGTGKKRGAKTKEERSALLKRKNEAIRETLLKDWDDEDVSEEEIDHKKPRDNEDKSDDKDSTLNESVQSVNSEVVVADQPAQEPIKHKEKSCFDFEDNDDDSTINLNESLKFGQKLPRVISDEKPKKQTEELNALKQNIQIQKKSDQEKNEALDEFNSLLEETKVPDIPDVPDKLGSDNEVPTTTDSENFEDKMEIDVQCEDVSHESHIVENEVIVGDSMSDEISSKNAEENHDELVIEKNINNLKEENAKSEENAISLQETSELVDPDKSSAIETEESKEKTVSQLEISELDVPEKSFTIETEESNQKAVSQLGTSELGVPEKSFATETFDSKEVLESSTNIPNSSIPNQGNMENEIITISNDIVKNEAEEKSIGKILPDKFHETSQNEELSHTNKMVPVNETFQSDISDDKPLEISESHSKKTSDRVDPQENVKSLKESSVTISENSATPQLTLDIANQDVQQMELDINSMPIVIGEDIITENGNKQTIEFAEPVQIKKTQSPNVSKLRIELRKVGDTKSTPGGQQIITIPGKSVATTKSSGVGTVGMKKSQSVLGKGKVISSLVPQKGAGGASQVMILKPQSSSGHSKFTVGKSSQKLTSTQVTQVISSSQVLNSQIVSTAGKVLIIPSPSGGANKIVTMTSAQSQKSGGKLTAGARIITSKSQIVNQAGQSIGTSIASGTKTGQKFIINKNSILTAGKSVILAKSATQTKVTVPQSVLNTKGLHSIVVSKAPVSQVGKSMILAPVTTKPASGQKIQILPQKSPTKLVMQRKSKTNSVSVSQQQIKVVPKTQANTIFFQTSQGLVPATTSSDKQVVQAARQNQMSIVSNVSQQQTKKQGVTKVRQISPNILQRSQRKQVARTATPQKQQFLSIPSTTISPNDIILAGNTVPVLTQNITPTNQQETVKMVYLTVDEHGNYHQVDNTSLISFDGNSDNALFIDPGTTDADNLYLSIDESGNLVNISHNVTSNTTTTTPSQDILAKALANTQVLQSDPSEISNTIETPIFVDQQFSAPTLSHNVLETSLTLNQPIMTPLEVPSSVSPSAIPQISTVPPTFLSATSSSESIKPKTNEIQPSMPLLTDELEVPAQTVFIDSNNLPVTTDSQLTFQLTIHDNSMLVSSTTGGMQNQCQDNTSSVSQSNLPRDDLVASATSVTHSASTQSKGQSIVSQIKFSSDSVKNKDGALNSESVSLTENILTGAIETNVVNSGSEFLNSEKVEFNKSEQSADSPGSEFLNPQAPSDRDNKRSFVKVSGFLSDESDKKSKVCEDLLNSVNKSGIEGETDNYKAISESKIKDDQSDNNLKSCSVDNGSNLSVLDCANENKFNMEGIDENDMAERDLIISEPNTPQEGLTNVSCSDETLSHSMNISEEKIETETVDNIEIQADVFSMPCIENDISKKVSQSVEISGNKNCDEIIKNDSSNDTYEQSFEQHSEEKNRCEVLISEASVQCQDISNTEVTYNEITSSEEVVNSADSSHADQHDVVEESVEADGVDYLIETHSDPKCESTHDLVESGQTTLKRRPSSDVSCEPSSKRKKDVKEDEER